MNWKSSIILCSIFAALSTYANAKDCKVQSLKEILDYVKLSHPKVILATHEFEVAKGKEIGAKEWLNPEFAGAASLGDSIEGFTYSLGASYIHSIETANKRKHRVTNAIDQRNVKDASKRKAVEESLIDVTLMLYKIKNNLNFKNLIEQNLKLFKEISKKYRSVKLDPNSTVDASLLEMEIGNLILEVSKLDSEKNSLERHIEFYMGLNCNLKSFKFKNVLFPSFFKRQYPEVSTSSEMEIADQELREARSLLKLEKANGVPDIKIGPTIEYEAQGVDWNYSVGASFSMKLPFFNTNEGGKYSALKEVEKRSRKLQLIKQENELDLRSLKRQHKLYLSSLDRIQNNLKNTVDLDKIFSYYQRGIIPLTSVIEFKKQYLELQSKKMQYKLGAIETYLNILKGTGNFEQFKY